MSHSCFNLGYLIAAICVVDMTKGKINRNILELLR